MSLPELIKELSDSGMMEKEALEVAIELMKIERLKELLGKNEFESERLRVVLKAVKNLPEQNRLAYSSLENLSKRETECFLMYHAENKSMQKIADELGITKSSVNQYIRRARDKVKA